MSVNDNTLTSGEFSQRTGIPVSTITKMLRDGIIRGEKRSGKWAIDEDQMSHPAIRARIEERASATGQSATPTPPAISQTAYDVETFARLTYLTESGVRKWFRTGRLDGGIDDDGQIRIDAANLEKPELQHLRR